MSWRSGFEITAPRLLIEQSGGAWKFPTVTIGKLILGTVNREDWFFKMWPHTLAQKTDNSLIDFSFVILHYEDQT